MSIEVTTIPKEPQWEDIVIDANKDFNLHAISRVQIWDGRLWHTRLVGNLDANNHQITNLPPSVHKGDALSMGNPIPTLAGDAPFSFNDIIRRTTSTTFVKLKETRIWRPGTYRISFDLASSVAGNWVFAIIRRNDVDVGTQRQMNHDFWITYTEDIAGWSSGDLVQIYGRSGHTGTKVEIRRLRLYIHESDLTEVIL